jgi:hypothetical protein
MENEKNSPNIDFLTKCGGLEGLKLMSTYSWGRPTLPEMPANR